MKRPIFSSTCKTLGVVFCFASALFMGAALAVTGDADLDGAIDAVDVQLVINAALGIDIGNYDADINNDHRIDAVDVQLITNAALGIDISGSIEPDTWQRTFSKAGIEGAFAMQKTVDGGFIIAGITGSLDDKVKDVLMPIHTDIYLVRIDSNGNEVWSRSYGEDGNEMAYDVQQTTDGGFIIAGSVYSTFGDWDDMYLLRTDSTGNKIWTKTYGGSEREGAYAVRQTEDEGFIIAGHTSSFGAGGNDIYLLKTDSDGNEEWSKTFGGSKSDNALALQLSADGGFVVVGDTDSFGAGSDDIYIVKTDSNGNEEWSNTYGGSSSDKGHAIQTTTDGGFVIVGDTESFGAVGDDIYIVKTDSKGNEEWSNTFGGSKFDRAYAVQQTPDGGFAIAGETYSFGKGSADMYLIKTDPSGNEVWSRTYGERKLDVAFAMQQTPDSGFVLAGHTDSFGCYGIACIYVVKADADGNSPYPPD